MRRGHPGAGSWRGENLRPFRPRGGGPPNFRPSRPFGLLDVPRFPPPGFRQFRGPRPFSQHPGSQDNILQSEHHDRNKYRINNFARPQGRGYHNRGQIPSFHHQSRQNDDHDDSYNESNYYPNTNQCHVNTMGDVDHRRVHPISPWVNNPPGFEGNRQQYDDNRSPHKTPRHYNMGDELPDYTGHRPPASDHYSTTTGPNNNNSQYSHSVDDTVDIIRKRLQNRDKQPNFDASMDHQSNVDEDLRKNTNDSCQNVPQEPPVRKRIQRQKQNIKSNCDKIKNKIVHQLFKMDKTKIHKLMDDPSSSHKFEYAISSMITEGQNSLNRHLRSAAEKSLCSSSTDFIQDDTNTIYEDTFMKQMQGVLDPQDTVLLEDIKPLVMAELSRVLQLDDFQFELMQDHGYQNQGMQDLVTHDQGMQNYVNEHDMYTKDEPLNCQYFDEEQNADQYSQDAFYDQNHLDGNTDLVTADVDERFYEFEHNPSVESKPLFERRPVNRVHETEKRKSSESRQSRSSIDNSFGYLQEEITKNSPKKQLQPITLFDPNTDQLSDDDDPFAELDKQYHVAVDHNFIGNEYASRTSSPVFSIASNSKSPNERLAQNTCIDIPSTKTSKVKKEFDVHIQNMTQSPQKLFSRTANTKTDPKNKPDVEVKKDPEHVLEKENLSAAHCSQAETATNHTPHGESSKKKEIKKEPEKHESSTSTKTVLQSNTRKRSTDQKPSHRKEKRKRSSQSECQGVAKSIMSMFYANENNKDSSKASKTPDSATKAYSDKYVKRKEPPKKARKKECDASKTDEAKKHDSNTPSHSNISPKDNLVNEIPSKSDPKKKLKPIDIFGAQILKKGNSHQAHRNTATTPQIAKSPDDNKPNLIVPIATSFARKLSKRHIGTQVISKVRTKECQTDKPKKAFKQTQTDCVTINKPVNITTNPLERMKEIDMEIQLLLQEKFKLYNSLETKAATASIDTIPSLSMRVFNVNTEQIDEKSNDSEDAIVDDFANMPPEELEQIAMETIADENVPDVSSKKSRRHKVAELMRKSSSASPTTKRCKKKVKSPNISLIEQIITDDRPIEEIISLDDLETTPVKSKKKNQKVPKKKSSKKTKPSLRRAALNTAANTISDYNIRKCYVILDRIDTSRYIRPKVELPFENPNLVTFEVPIVDITPEDNTILKEEPTYASEAIHSQEEVEPSMLQVVEDVVNDLQFDMLDVSEDIVIGDNCEVKTIDKVKETISEEIILDNSQSSMEDVAQETAGNENECKMYDYSNESLRRDAITVTGNADAVLAIEQADLMMETESGKRNSSVSNSKLIDFGLTDFDQLTVPITDFIKPCLEKYIFPQKLICTKKRIIISNGTQVFRYDCIDDNFIAACLDGNVYHFSGDGQLLNTLRGTNQAVTCLTIVKEKYGTTVYTGSLDSRMRYYDLETGMEKGPECNVLSPIQTMDRAWDTIFVGTRTGFVLQFECKNNMVIPVSTVKFSEQSILALRAMKEGPRKVLLVAARSENVVTVKDAQTGLLLRTLQGPKMTVYTLLYEDGKVYCGTSSHNIHVFDYTSGGHVGSHEGGKGAVCLRASGGLVFAGCYDGCVYVYREGEARPRAQLRGPGLMLLSLAIHGTKIIAGYKDRGLYIWKMPLAIVQEMIL